MTNERLRQSIEQLTDHQRECAGRDYTCTCGYDDARDSRLEAFKQEVSDAVFAYYGGYHNASGEPLERFIIGKPKPDPLVEVLNSLWGDSFSHFDDPEAGQLFRAALEARGLEIREKGE